MSYTCSLHAIPGLYYLYIFVRFYLLYTFSGCKDSANRMKYQIYLEFSEVKPIFNARKATLKLVQTERKTKFYLSFSEVKPNFLMQSSKKIVQTERK